MENTTSSIDVSPNKNKFTLKTHSFFGAFRYLF